MPAFAHVRLLDAFSRLEERSRHRLLARLSTGELAQGVGELSTEAGISLRVGLLTEEDRRSLADLSVVAPEMLAGMLEPGIRGRLEGLGLLFSWPAAGGDGGESEEVVLPFEVRMAQWGLCPAEDADLAMLLSAREEEELHELALLHDVEGVEEGDRAGLALAVAAAVLEEDALRGLWDSLQPSSRRLLQWMLGQGTPVTEASLRARVERRGGVDGEGVPAAERVLLRLGLVHRLEAGGGVQFVLPQDVRWSLTLLLDEVLAEEAAERWQDVRGSALPSFRDVFPRGAGGDPLHAARARLVQGLVYGPGPERPIDGVLSVLGVLDAEGSSPGELASLHLDVSGPDAMARHAMRTWLSVLNDPWTSGLLGAFGGDAPAMAVALAPGKAGEADPLESDRQRWSELLVQLRGHLLFALSVLPGGHWFRVDLVARWMTSMYALVLHRTDAMAVWGPGVPVDALPLSVADMESDTDGAVAGALRALFAELFAPLGVLTLDASGGLFLVNGEALRSFRDGDPGFDVLWGMAEAYLGDDLDLWLPLPNDPGVRVSGVASLRWVSETVLAVEDAVHLHDLLRLAQWSAPMQDGAGLLFVFDAQHVARGEESGGDAEDFLLWLRVRTGQALPAPMRALFSMSSAQADGTEPAVAAAVAARVEALYDRLRSWGDSPSLAVMEELRSWGPAVVRQLLPRVEGWVKRRRFERTELPHVLLLLGELGDARACPVLLRTLAYAEDEGLEGVAAMACARIGLPALQGLVALLSNGTAGMEKQLAAAATLCSVAVLHPSLSEAVFDAVSRFLEGEEVESDVVTIAGVHLAETGHPDVEALLYQLREQGVWMEELMPFDEAVWVAGISPGVWGHPFYAAPLALIFPTSSESRHLTEEAGIDELLRDSGLARDTILGSLTGPAWKRRRS
ncbi:MAG: hypothetical protein EA398_16870 [Deltaproteobacteria bacterium]|nr:MAG: hypothetical protein EA398_16870 [Deltaproteobacteria bacterium]